MMLEEQHEDGWNTAKMEKPFGRGVNFSIAVDNIEEIYEKLAVNQYPLFRSIMHNRYECNGKYIEQQEFLVQDPDGYLLRFTHE